MPSATKLCRACGKQRRLSAFYPNDRAMDGLRYRCKECDKAATRADYAAMPPDIKKVVLEIRREERARYHAIRKATPEGRAHHSRQSLAYYYKNRDKINARRRAEYTEAKAIPELR